MDQTVILWIALLLVAFGVAVWFIIRWSIVHTSKDKPQSTQSPLQDETEEIPTQAVLIVQAGGKLISVNSRARQLFHIPSSSEPNFERITRLIRPSDEFLRLCSQGGLGQLSIEGVSFNFSASPIPVTAPPWMVITINMDLDSTYPHHTDPNTLEHPLGLPIEDKLFSSLDLQYVVTSLLNRIERNFPTDFLQLFLWESKGKYWSPFKLEVITDETKQAVQSFEQVIFEQGIISTLISEIKPVLITDLSSQIDDRLKNQAGNLQLRSYMAVPLLANGELIGIIEAGSVLKEAYQTDDLNMLIDLTYQSGIALKNASLFNYEQKQITELTSLINLSKAMTTVREPQVLFNHLVESIVPLFDVEIFGFLIFDENRRVLQGQAPFIGLPEKFLNIYSLPVEAGSPVENFLIDQDVIISEDAANDPQVEVLGLHGLAQAASLREMAMAPLVVGGRTIGYIQVGNHKGAPRNYSKEELQMLLAVSNQAAPIVENFLLVQQSRKRAQRSEALRRIGSLASSAVTLDEVLKYSLQELMHLIKADFGCIFLVDEDTRELTLHLSSATAGFPKISKKGIKLSLDDPQYSFTIGGSQHSFTLDRVFEEQSIIPFYQNLIKEWRAQSAMAVPLIVNDVGIGELWIVSHDFQPFDQGDLQVMGTAAGLLAGVVERSILSTQTDEKLRRRIQQMSSLNRISREMSAATDIGSLLQLIYDEAIRITQADCGTLYIFDIEQTPQNPPHIVNQIGPEDHNTKRLGTFESEILSDGKSVLIPDLTANGTKPPHKGIKGLLVIPIILKGKPVGLLSLHSCVSGKFDQDSFDIAQSLATQVAVSLESAAYEKDKAIQSDQIKHDLEIMAGFSELSNLISPEQPLEEKIGLIGGVLGRFLSFRDVEVYTFDEEAEKLTLIWWMGTITSPESQPSEWNEIKAWIKHGHKLGGGYLIQKDLSAQNGVQKTKQESNVKKSADCLVIPLYSKNQEPLGVIILADPDEVEIHNDPYHRKVDLFAGQVRYVLEGHNSIHKLQKGYIELQSLQTENSSRINEISGQLGQSKLSGDSLHNELSWLRRHEGWLQLGMQFIHEVISNEEPRQVFRNLSAILQENLGFNLALLSRQIGSDSELIEVIGEVPEGVNPDSLFGQRNPLRQTLLDDRFEVCSDISTNETWKAAPLLVGLKAKGFLSIPFTLPGYPPMAVMWVRNEVLPEFSDGDYQLIKQISDQVENAIQNQVLIKETRQRLKEMDILLDYTRKLGSPSQTEIVNALLQTTQLVIPTAQVIWICLLDPHEQVLFVEACFGMADMDAAKNVRFGGPVEEGQAASLPWRVWHSHEVVRISEVEFAHEYLLTADDLLAYRKACDGRLPISCMALPLLVGENCFGVMLLENQNIPAVFTADDETLALSLAQQAALAIQNAQLFLETRRLTEDLEKRVEERTTDLRREHDKTQTLLRIITELSSSLDLDQVLSRTLGIINDAIGSDQSLIVVTSKLDLAYHAGKPLVKVGKAEQSIAQRVAKTRQPLLIEDARSDPQLPNKIQDSIAYSSLIAVPLMMGEEVLGALMLVDQRIGYFKAEQINLLQAIARQVSVSLNNAELYTLIRDQAENQGGMLRAQQIEASRSRAILEAVADGVMVTDASNKVTLVNFSAERILSLKANVVVGNPIERLESIFGPATRKWVLTIRKWTEAPNTSRPPESFVEVIELDNGRIVAVNLAPVIWRSSFLGTVSIFRDITSEVRLDRMKSEFVANVSHELRTPMTSIKGYVDIMLMGASGDLNEKQVHFLDIIRTNTQRLSILVNDLLDISRIESGSVNLNFQDIDLYEMIRDVVHGCQRRAEEIRKLMKFEVDVEPNLPPVKADMERLRQVLNALMVNGLNYTEAGGVIKVIGAKKEGFIQIDVIDNGIGIPVEDQPRIFERFYRGNDPLVLEAAGTGLGLVMAKTLVEMHHGRLWFSSEGVRGKGSIFSFSLPY